MTDDASNQPGYSPHEIAAAERLLAREQEQAVHRGDERRRWLQRLSDGNDARERLETEAFYPARDDGMVDHYDGDHAAVIAETPEGQRKDGWTVERRLLFLDRLAEHGSIVSACRAVGVTRQSVYKLRPRAPAFAAAMDEAIRSSTALLADVLFDRALHGHQVPVLHQGEVVATRTVHHDALGLYLLRVRDPLNYAPIDELDRWKKHRAIDAAPAPAAPPTDLIGQERCLPLTDGGFDPATFHALPAPAAPAPAADPDPATVSTSTTSPS
ncbi:hypothetical protein [Sphingomonas humi]|uniref:Uncharacterized protein n=1 Tax=Sphingomonas humi TaxID=335630 RepID=A0ABP7SFD7_9SPHN